MREVAVVLSCILMMLWTTSGAGQIKLVESGRSRYFIVIPDAASKTEKDAANALRSIILAASGANLPIVKEAALRSDHAIFIGKCSRTGKGNFDLAKDDGFTIAGSGPQLFIVGKSGQGTMYGAYYFAEQYLGCRKYDSGPPEIPRQEHILLPADIKEIVSPDFIYRQSYYPQSNNAEYLRWHGLQQFEDLWGLWGHSYFKLIPPAKYFSTNPEYFALVNGQRRTTQLCLSNKKVLELSIQRLKELMADNPDALYWSVAPNDEGGYCTCDLCRKIDDPEGGPSGSLIRFVNKIAASFPDKSITTLGYGYTSAAPLKTRPAKNVYVLLSSIDAYKDQPIADASSAAALRTQLSNWSALTSNIFMWDYCTQFTNYLSPFPVQHVIGADLAYYSSKGVKGIFEQGSGETYSDMAELNSYLQAKLLWDSRADVQKIIKEFCEGYYGKAAPFILKYLAARTEALRTSQRRLDIYGSPINDRKGYLSPGNIDTYDTFLEQAHRAVEGTLYEDRVKRVRLSLDYVVLQQSRHFGVEQFGFLEQGGAAFYNPKNGWKAKVERFCNFAERSGVTELAELGLSPKAYQAEWEAMLLQKWPVNPVQGAGISFKNMYVEDYPAKGKGTLVDGMTGFEDFSYNWLCFYGQDMVATVDAGTPITVSTVNLNFLEDQRHWIFPPEAVIIETSNDGVNFREFKRVQLPVLSEKSKTEIRSISVKGKTQKVRYIRVAAICPKELPSWRNYGNKQAMIACDEIFILPD